MAGSSRTTYHTSHIYDAYLKKGGTLDWKVFKKVCYAFNKRVMDLILQGKWFDMGHYLSSIMVIRQKRNWKYNKGTKSINWAESFKLKEELEEEGIPTYNKETCPEGKKWFVYFDTPWYCKFYWFKKRCQIPNQKAYAFKATRGKPGNKTKLKKILEEDDLAHLNFKLVDRSNKKSK